MADRGSQGSEGFQLVVATVLILLCMILSGMVIARSESTVEGIAIIVTIAVTGLLYGLLAVRADERRERESDRRD